MISLVVPVYNEAENVKEFVVRVSEVLAANALDYEIIFCVDPSTDGTEAIISEKNRTDSRIKSLVFSRRFGQSMATLAGLDYATGEAVIVMDVDLQDPPELIPQLVQQWQAGFDVVYAQRSSRAGETLVKRLVAFLGYRFMNWVCDIQIPKDTGDFRLMSRKVVQHVLALPEKNGYLRGLVAYVGFSQTKVIFDRPARFSGVGNYSRFIGSIRIGLNGIVCFSSRLLTLSSTAGVLIAFAAFVIALIYVVMKLMGVPFPIGNPTIVVLVLFMGGIQLISVGILGEYIARIYEEVKARPRYIVAKTLGLEERVNK